MEAGEAKRAPVLGKKKGIESVSRGRMEEGRAREGHLKKHGLAKALLCSEMVGVKWK